MITKFFSSLLLIASHCYLAGPLFGDISIPKWHEEISSSGPFHLNTHDYQLSLPDLSDQIRFLGKNERPDCEPSKNQIFLGLKRSDEVALAQEGKPLYLLYQREAAKPLNPNTPSNSIDALWSNENHSSTTPLYRFSPRNAPTPLWIEPILDRQNNRLFVSVHISCEKEQLVVEPKEHKSFVLSCETFQNLKQPFLIGAHRVDSTLLVRQRARLVGVDQFLENHGGKEYANYIGRVRIDFLDEESPYSCFIKEGEFLYWNGSRWKECQEPEESSKAPILVLQTLNDKMATLEIWSEKGMQKITLHLARAQDNSGFPDLNHEIKFLTAKTWALFTLECRGQKVTVKPNDWLVLTHEGWVLLNTVKLVEEFVDQKIQGPLLVIGKLKQERGRQRLTATLYNTLRTDSTLVELEQSSSFAPLPAILPSIFIGAPETGATNYLKGEKHES